MGSEELPESVPETPEHSNDYVSVANAPESIERNIRMDTIAGGEKDRYWLHLLLFGLTVITTVYSGGEMTSRFDYYEASGTWMSIFGLTFNDAFLLDGLRFSASLLLFLTVHEFGHYFAARHHRVNTTLPFFIPFPFNGIGTFGAVIRIRERIPSMTKLFDIGIAGPIAGFVIAVTVLLFGLVTLPSPDYVMDLGDHEALKSYVQEYGEYPSEILQEPSAEGSGVLLVGSTPLYWFLTQFFDDVPPLWEMYHYPFLFAGWLGLFFTALNLLPVGQLDGGHMLYALIGPRWHQKVARMFVLMLLVSGGVGFISDLGPPISQSFSDWISVPGLDTEVAPWLVLSIIMFMFLQRIFNRSLVPVVTGLLGILGLVAVLSWYPRVVSSFGYVGWLFWCLLIVTLIRVEHPPVENMEPLSTGRKALAILGLLIFALCFSIKPLYFA